MELRPISNAHPIFEGTSCIFLKFLVCDGKIYHSLTHSFPHSLIPSLPDIPSPRMYQDSSRYIKNTSQDSSRYVKDTSVKFVDNYQDLNAEVNRRHASELLNFPLTVHLFLSSLMNFLSWPFFPENAISPELCSVNWSLGESIFWDLGFLSLMTC